MGNKYRYVDIDLDKPRKLRYDMNALCELEDVFDKPIMEVLAEIETGMSIKLVRAVLWAGLIHEDEELTQRQVGTMIDMSNIMEVQEKLTEAISTSMSGKNAKGPETKKVNQSGTGMK